MAATFVLRENVDLGLELGVRSHGLRGGENHATDHVLLFGAAEEEADVVARLGVVEELAEHFHARDDVFDGLAEADAFDLVVQVHDAAFDTAGSDGAAARDREDVFDRHQERLVGLALRQRDVGVAGFHEFHDLVLVGGVAFEGLEGGAADDRGVVAVKFVLGQEFADFHLDEVEEFRVVDHVALVQEHDDLRHANLVGEEDVFAGLRHRAVSGGNDEDGAVHLGSTGHHVLHVVGVPRAVDVGVVTVGSGVFHVRGVNRDTTGLFFRSVVDFVETLGSGETAGCESRADCGGQSGFTVVNVADGANVAVRLASVKMFFCHDSISN